MSFIEEHCIIFDTEEENKLEYTQIHHVRRPVLIGLGIQQDSRGVARRADGGAGSDAGAVFVGVR